MPKLMTRSDILNAPDIGFEDIDLGDIPGWGLVRIKDLTASERDKLEASLVTEVRTKAHGRKNAVQVERKMQFDNVRAAFCAACICDESLQPVFGRDDLTALGGKSAKALDRIFTRIQSRNGLSDSDVESLIENFDNGQGGASLSV